MKDMFVEYINEREGKEVLVEDFGFCTYEMYNEYFYLCDVYIKKERRGDRLSEYFVNKGKEIAKKNNCTIMLSSFSLKDPGWKKSRHILRRLGFKFFNKNKPNKMIYVSKEI